MPITKIAHSVLEENQENYINILRLGHSIADSGWTTYSNLAGINPVNGLGAGAGITWSQNTVNPLSGDVDLRLVKDANNRQGNGVSIPFTIANRHLGKVLQISFDMELISGNYENPIPVPVTGTYSISSTTCTVTASHSFVQGQFVFITFTSGTAPANGYYTITSVTATTFVFTVASGSGTGNCNYTAIGDLRVSIIQNPNSVTPVMIEPVNTNLQLGIANQRIRHIASFQTDISITSYRLCIHVGSGSTVAYTVDFANFRVWEPTQSVGAVITDWQSYTPTLSGFVTSSQDFQWRRVGGDIEIQGRWITSSGSANEFRVPLPNGLIIDPLRVPSLRVVGLMGYNASASTYFGSYATAEPSVSYITGSYQSSTINNLTKRNGGDWTSGIATFTIQATVPIQGWGSSVAMSSDSGDGRVVGLFLTGTPSSSISGNAAATWSSVSQIRDTHGAYNSTTGIYTAPISGFYSVSGHFNTNLSVNVGIYPWINGVQVAANFGVSPSSGLVNFSGQVFLNSGDQLTLRPTSGWSAVSGGSFLNISRISAGSQVIATQETVACWVFASSNTSNGSTSAPFILQAKQFDTHGIYSISTGRFTIPFSGKYMFSGNIVMTGQTQLYAYRSTGGGSASNYAYITRADNTTGDSTFSVIYDLISGDTIDFRPSASVFANGGTITNNAISQIFCQRLGI